MKNKLPLCYVIGALKRLFLISLSRIRKETIMATRYAGKYRRNPYPQATRIKTFNFLRYLSLGGTFWHPPQVKFSFFAVGKTFFTGGGVAPIRPYFAPELERGPNLSRPRRDIIASRPRRDFKVTRRDFISQKLENIKTIEIHWSMGSTKPSY